MRKSSSWRGLKVILSSQVVERKVLYQNTSWLRLLSLSEQPHIFYQPNVLNPKSQWLHECPMSTSSDTVSTFDASILSDRQLKLILGSRTDRMVAKWYVYRCTFLSLKLPF
jgi:hypothetical protein